jgi:hypothetical protein
MKRIGIWASLAITFSALTLPAYAAPCSNATLKGVYGYSDTQHDFGVNYYIVGFLRFDGTGKGSTSWILRGDDGTIGSDPVGSSISYTVAPDCTFTFTHQTGLTFSGVIDNNANELRYVEVTGWQFRTGSAVSVSSKSQQ